MFQRMCGVWMYQNLLLKPTYLCRNLGQSALKISCANEIIFGRNLKFASSTSVRKWAIIKTVGYFRRNGSKVFFVKQK